MGAVVENTRLKNEIVAERWGSPPKPVTERWDDPGISERYSKAQ
jgi:hypothetical protein